MDAVTCWERAERPPELTVRCVDVWYTRVGVGPYAEVLGEMLVDDERRRADRYRIAEVRQRFIAGRARLRQLLGYYLGLPPRTVPIGYNAFGKPGLRGGAGGIEFNASASGDAGLIALAIGRPLGVDIERVRGMQDLDGMARRYFSADEQRALQRLAPQQRTRGFFRAWTRKEAVVKSVGTGLQTAPERISVSLEADDSATLITWDGQPPPPAWWLHPLDPLPGFVAAIAWQGKPAELRTWSLPDEAPVR